MDLKQRAAKGGNLSGLQIIDAHAHLGPHRGSPLFGDPSAAGMVALMDEVGMAGCLCSALIAVGPDFTMGNDMVQQAMAQFPGRFFGMCVIDPNYPAQIVPELEKRMAQGFTGVKIHPYSHHRYANDDHYRALYEYAHAHSLIIKSHTYNDGNYSNMVNDPALFAGLAGTYPNATFILGHSGGAPIGHEEAIKAAKQHDNIYLELCSTLMFTAQWLEQVVNEIGDERVFYGSDMPVYDPRAAIGVVLYAKIPDRSKERILGQNVRKLIKL